MGSAQRRLSNLRIIRIALCRVAREADSFPCSFFADQGTSGRLINVLRRQEHNADYEYENEKARALAFAKARCATVARGDSALVRHFQPPHWSGNRVSGSLVCYVADKLGKQ